MPSNNSKPKEEAVAPVQDSPLIQKLLGEMQELRKSQEVMEQRLIEKERELDERQAKLDSFLKADVKAVAQVREVHQSKKEIMREKLMTQPTVRMYIPLNQGEKAGQTHPVTLNGFRINVPKGVYVDVPQQVADVLKDSFQQTEDAGKAFRLDLNRGVSKEGISTEFALG